MKKTYILPQTWAVEIKAEEMLALSMGVNTGGSGTDYEVGGDDEWLTRNGGWSSEDWSDVEDEE